MAFPGIRPNIESDSQKPESAGYKPNTRDERFSSSLRPVKGTQLQTRQNTGNDRNHLKLQFPHQS